MKNRGFALGLSIAIAIGGWSLLKVFSVKAASIGSSPGFATGEILSGSGADDLTPGSSNYGWWQFASFLNSQSKVGVVGPAGFPAPANLDPDWAGTWMNKGQLKLGTQPCGVNGQTGANINKFALEFPVQLKIASTGPARASAPGTPANVPCQGIQQVVLYNSTASKEIIKQHLAKVRSMKALLSTGTNVVMDNHSIIIKELWEPIGPNQTPIPIWQPGNTFFSKPRPADTYGEIQAWQPKITINASAQPGTYKPTVSAPVSAFAHMTIGGAAYVLVGINIAHKVNGTWYWLAFYWADAQMNALSGQTQCSSASGQYCMKLTSDAAGSEVCFNPYLEGQQAQGLYSNCIRCHQFAAYPKNEIDGVSVIYGSNPTPDPLALQHYMNGAISTDRLWSLITHLPQPQSQ